MTTFDRRKAAGLKHMRPRALRDAEQNNKDFICGYLAGLAASAFNKYAVTVGYADNVLDCGAAFAVEVKPSRKKQAQPDGRVVSDFYCDLTGFTEASNGGTASMRLEKDTAGRFAALTFAFSVEPRTFAIVVKPAFTPA